MLKIFILTLCFLSTNTQAAQKRMLSDEDLQKIKACTDLLTGGTEWSRRYTFGTLKQFESGLFSQNASHMRTSLLGFYGNWIKFHSELPSENDIQGYFEYVRSKQDSAETSPINPKIFGKGGAFSNLEELLEVIQYVQPEFLNDIYSKILQQTALFIRHRMRPPTIRELAEAIHVKDLRLLMALTSDQNATWKALINSDVGRHIDYARKRIKTAYARAVRGTDTALVNRTRKIAPTLRRMTEIMILTKSNEHFQWRAMQGDYGKFALENPDGSFKVSEFEKMMTHLGHELAAAIGIEESPMNKSTRPEDRWIFPMPKLFPGGLDELHSSAVREYQPTFTSFEDTQRFGMNQAQKVKDKIEKAPGFIVAEVRPGLKVNWELVDGMIKYSKSKGYPIVLIPADGMFQDLDPDILKHPDLNVLTATIENRELSLRLFPNNMRKNPFSVIKEQGMYEIGQQIIIPHHTLAMEVIPTAQNHLNQTKIYASGSINLPEVAGIGKAGKARAEIMAKSMKAGFTVMEKIDRGEDRDFEGVGNHWHGRPIEFRAAEGEQPAVFVDGDMAYKIRKGPRKNIVSVEKTGAVHFLLPDVHFIVANPHIMKALKDLFSRYIADGLQVVLVLPDPIDSKAINAHVEKKQMNQDALHKLYKSGGLSFEDEINDAIGNVNVLLTEFPLATVVFQYSNHSDEWIQRDLMNNPSWLQLIINGKLISEIRTACDYNGWTPLEYLLLHRRKMLDRIVIDKSDSYKEKAVFISDPSRVRTMRAGEPLSSSDMNPDYRTFFHHHGHQGANGGRSSFKTHMRGEKRIITGDAHRPGYEGRGDNMWIGVGATSYQQDYTAGGYSSWGTPIALVSPYGTMGFFDYDPYSKAYMQRPEIGPLPPSDFFGNDPLKVIAPMDDDQRRRDLDSQEFLEWFKTQRQWLIKGQSEQN